MYGKDRQREYLMQQERLNTLKPNSGVPEDQDLYVSRVMGIFNEMVICRTPAYEAARLAIVALDKNLAKKFLVEF